MEVRKGTQQDIEEVAALYENNMPAIRLYEKMGFHYIGTVDLGYGKYGLDWYKLYQYLL